MVFRKSKKQDQKIGIYFLILGEAPLDKSQVTRYFMCKTRASRPLALEPLTSCFASSAPNDSTCNRLYPKEIFVLDILYSSDFEMGI